MYVVAPLIKGSSVLACAMLRGVKRYVERVFLRVFLRILTFKNVYRHAFHAISSSPRASKSSIRPNPRHFRSLYAFTHAVAPKTVTDHASAYALAAKMVTDSPLTPSRQARGKITRARELTGYQRIEIRTLRSVGYTYMEIVEELGYTWRQIQRVMIGPFESRKKGYCGRKDTLVEWQIQYLLKYLRESKVHRRLPWDKLTFCMPFHCTEKILRLLFRKLGDKCYIARRKPPLSAKKYTGTPRMGS